MVRVYATTSLEQNSANTANNDYVDKPVLIFVDHVLLEYGSRWS